MPRVELNRTGLASRYPQLEYGVRIFERVVDKPVFSGLGYTDVQASIAETVVAGLRNRRCDTQTMPSLSAYFPGNRRGEGLNVALLRSGGYAIDGFYDITEELPKIKKDQSNATEVLLAAVSFKPERDPRVPIPETPILMAQFRLLPSMLAGMDRDLLIRFIYEGSEGSNQKIALTPKDEITSSLSRDFKSMAVFDASFSDLDNRELLVLTDFADKGDGVKDPQVNYEHWKRLDPVEIDQQVWVPFARTSIDYRFPE